MLAARSVLCGQMYFLPVADSTVASGSMDSTAIARRDSLAAKDTLTKKSSGIDSVVTYTAADSLVYMYHDRTMDMFGKSNVKYKTMGLDAERISIDYKISDMEAVGVFDTVKALRTDTLKQRYRGTPIMMDGGEKYEGWRIGYNFKSQKGRITLAETVMDQGYYYGQHIKKVEKDVLYVADGRFTTCDRGHPHYFFTSPRMKVTLHDKIVAEPIYLYVADVPIFVLPFGVFPSQSGRRSGIIAPAYGDDATHGKYISHLGYYDAISDYTDLSLAGDWYTNGSWQLYPEFRYNKRYEYNGGFSGRYGDFSVNEKGDPDYSASTTYRASLRHNQTFNPTTQLNVDFTFASNNSYRTSNNYNDYLQQEIYSNATLSKSWEGTNNSMSITISRRQNLQNGDIDATVPTINFSHAQSYPFRQTKKTRGMSLASESGYAWYEMIGMSYSGQGMYRNSKTSTGTTGDFMRYERQGISHTIRLNASPKAGYFTVTPSISYYENWYDKSIRVVGVDTATNQPIKTDVKGFDAVRYFSAGLSASTKFYGMFLLPIPGVVGIRHTVTPALSYFYQPDFSESGYGYYSTYVDKYGITRKYDKFEKEIYRGAPSGKNQSIGLNVGNVFEMKTAAKDTSEKDKKFQLLNAGASISYNFAGDSLRLSDLTLNYRTDIGQYLGISGNSTYRFYDYDRTAGHRINKFLVDQGKGIAEMTSFSLSVSSSLSGQKNSRTTTPADSVAAAERQNNISGFRRMYEEESPDFSIPWNLSASFNFSQYQENPAQKTRSANVSGNLGFNLTENWRFTASASYDVIQKQFAAPRIAIYRDLHCWEMNFTWSPLGQMSGYRFELKVKAPQLQDIKVTKQSRDSGYY
jgi:lipopolysaccharide assembly outer membrane protein LptD (OstA)